MAGTINSLGIGSGVLTSNVIDQLKSNDESLIIKPIDNKITLAQQKSQALDLVSSLITSFKANVSSLSDDMLYQKRTVSGSNDGVKVTALSGVAVQSFSISNVQLAKKDVIQSGSFVSSTSSVLKNPSLLAADFTGTMSLTLDSKDPASTNTPKTFTINYNKNTTLQDLKIAINDAAGSSVTASILQTGNSAYSLVITSKETGETQALTLTDSTGELADQINTGMQTIQNARDATFDYNGISITRSSNTISSTGTDALIVGIDISLLQDNASSNISITQNTQAIADDLKGLTTSYNSLMKQLDDMTLSDLENGKVGIFNGDNSIKSIKREITRMMTSYTPDGNSLAQYGISLAQNGTMSFTQSAFDTKISSNTTELEAFFSGSTNTKGKYISGVFENLDTLLHSYTKSDGQLNNLITSSKNEIKSLDAGRTRSKDLLTARYETLTARFVQYDAIISRINSQFSSLQQQIQMAVNAK